MKVSYFNAKSVLFKKTASNLIIFVILYMGSAKQKTFGFLFVFLIVFRGNFNFLSLNYKSGIENVLTLSLLVLY